MFEQHKLNGKEYRVYGPHVYVYDPSDKSKHSINGYSPIDIPLNRFMFKLADKEYWVNYRR
jgi:hypothetical protein